ncbi:MAG: response regulator [Rhodospirillales bacterium]|nr:response regulator [Rhodospirillales bacterium]
MDDEPLVLEALRRALRPESNRWTMHFQASSNAALEAALKDPYDVVVTDLHMPNLGGLEFLDRLKSSGRKASSIVLTGTGDLASAMEAINRLGVFRFYTKPCPAERLREGINAALALRSRPEPPASDPARTALDRLPIAVLALDADRRVIFMNKQGALLLSNKRGLTVDSAGICRTLWPDATKALGAAIDRVLAGQDTAVLPLPLADVEERLSLLVTAAKAEDGDAKILFYVQDPQKANIPAAEHLRSLFGLTKAEAELARCLAQGCDLSEAAGLNNITVNSARTYLKSVFSKTNTNRQADLVRLLLTLAVPI